MGEKDNKKNRRQNMTIDVAIRFLKINLTGNQEGKSEIVGKKKGQVNNRIQGDRRWQLTLQLHFGRSQMGGNQEGKNVAEKKGQ